MASFESAVTVDDGRSAGDSAIKLFVCVTDAPAEQARKFVPPIYGPSQVFYGSCKI